MLTDDLQADITKSRKKFRIPFFSKYKEMESMLELTQDKNFKLFQKMKNQEEKISKLEDSLEEKEKLAAHLERSIEALEGEVLKRDSLISVFQKRQLPKKELIDRVNLLESENESKKQTISQLQKKIESLQTLLIESQIPEILAFFKKLGKYMNTSEDLFYESSDKLVKTARNIDHNLNVLKGHADKVVREIEIPRSAVYQIPTEPHELLGLDGYYNSPETVRKAKIKLLNVLHPDKINTNIPWVKNLFTELAKTINSST